MVFSRLHKAIRPSVVVHNFCGSTRTFSTNKKTKLPNAFGNSEAVLGRDRWIVLILQTHKFLSWDGGRITLCNLIESPFRIVV